MAEHRHDHGKADKDRDRADDEAGGNNHAPDGDRHRIDQRCPDRGLHRRNGADIPVEQPTRYELVVNLRAAQEYGQQVPAAFLVRADRVVR